MRLTDWKRWFKNQRTTREHRSISTSCRGNFTRIKRESCHNHRLKSPYYIVCFSVLEFVGGPESLAHCVTLICEIIFEVKWRVGTTKIIVIISVTTDSSQRSLNAISTWSGHQSSKLLLHHPTLLLHHWLELHLMILNIMSSIKNTSVLIFFPIEFFLFLPTKSICSRCRWQ